MSNAMNEEEIQSAISSGDADWKRVRSGLESLYRAGEAGKADALVDLAEGELKEKGLIDPLLMMYEERALRGGDLKAGQSWGQIALNIIGAEWEQKALVEQAGFDSGIAPHESFRRLQHLRKLKEGAVCYDKSWGTGVVGKIDYFYKRVDIDFRKKRGHQLALSYAAEKLLLLDESHPFFWQHQKPDELKAKLANEPGDVVKMTIKSFGPLNIVQLQETLSPEIVPLKDWKNFWDGARKQLKKDKHVQVPGNRKDAIRLIDSDELDQAKENLGGIGEERNLNTLAQRFEEIAGEVGDGGLTPKQREILQERLAFVVKGAWPRHPTVLARVKMAAVSLGVDDESKPALAAIDNFFAPRVFMDTLKLLPVKQSAQFIRYLSARDQAKVDHLMIDQMRSMDISSMSEVISYLMENGKERTVADIFRAAVETRAPGVEVLSWLSRNMDKVAAWNLGPMNLILNFMVDEIENTYSGDELKAQNQLKERWSKSDWMKSAMGQLEPAHREVLVMRVKNSSGWAVLDKQSQLAVMVKLHPELEALMAAAAREEQEDKPKGPLTSVRSYEERKEQLQRIINFEIPKVAKEIAVAREYGDLRENFEYKAAKDAQALLFRRRDEIGAMLAKVTPSDFKDMPAEKAGLATTVEVRYGDGRTEEFHLLGEWDTDPTLRIISSNSRMAQVLSGHVAGDSLMVPTEDGEETCTIAAVKPLPEHIRMWIERK
ncbi:MAG: GreA/GreB family elongation factor [Kiritimatiellia bacterium]|jgi:transcription elongation GreA/GreB family factor